MNLSRPYGYELIVDLHDGDPSTFNRASLEAFFETLCRVIDMEKCDVHFWDDIGVSPEEQQSHPKTKGTSAVCFILTSTIVVHTLDSLHAVYVNIFSCKEFDERAATACVENSFKGTIRHAKLIKRV